MATSTSSTYGCRVHADGEDTAARYRLRVYLCPKNLRTSYLYASERLFLDNPTMDGTAKLDPSFVGRDRTDTSWSETMFLYCQYC